MLNSVELMVVACLVLVLNTSWPVKWTGDFDFDYMFYTYFSIIIVHERIEMIKGFGTSTIIVAFEIQDNHSHLLMLVTIILYL